MLAQLWCAQLDQHSWVQLGQSFWGLGPPWPQIPRKTFKLLSSLRDLLIQMSQWDLSPKVQYAIGDGKQQIIVMVNPKPPSMLILGFWWRYKTSTALYKESVLLHVMIMFTQKSSPGCSTNMTKMVTRKNSIQGMIWPTPDREAALYLYFCNAWKNFVL